MRPSLEKQKLILRESIKLDSGKLIDSMRVLTNLDRELYAFKYLLLNEAT